MSEQINALPQYDRAKIKTEVGFYSTLFRMIETGRECIIPAIVEKYDRATGVATVKPLALRVYDTKDGEKTTERQSYDVPVWRFIQGGYTIDAPLYVGSTGYLFAVDRNCKDAMKNNSFALIENQSDNDIKNKGSERPSDNSLASFMWGFFLPFSWSDTKIEDDDAIVIKKTTSDGDVASVKIDKEGIEARCNSITAYCNEVNANCDALTAICDKLEVANPSNTKRISLSDLVISLSDSSSGAEVSISGAELLVKYGEEAKITINQESIEASNGNSIATFRDGSVSVTNGTDEITIGDSGIVHSGPIDMMKTMITDIRYDKTLHQLQKKVMPVSIRGDFIVGHENETDWMSTDGGQAVPEQI